MASRKVSGQLVPEWIERLVLVWKPRRRSPTSCARCRAASNALDRVRAVLFEPEHALGADVGAWRREVDDEAAWEQVLTERRVVSVRIDEDVRERGRRVGDVGRLLERVEELADQPVDDRWIDFAVVLRELGVDRGVVSLVIDHEDGDVPNANFPVSGSVAPLRWVDHL